MMQYASEATPQMQLGDKIEGSQNDLIEQDTILSEIIGSELVIILIRLTIL